MIISKWQWFPVARPYAHSRNHLALLHIIARIHIQLAVVGIQGIQAVSMADLDVMTYMRRPGIWAVITCQQPLHK